MTTVTMHWKVIIGNPDTWDAIPDLACFTVFLTTIIKDVFPFRRVNYFHVVSVFG
jgi:hypothetical protein